MNPVVAGMRRLRGGENIMKSTIIEMHFPSEIVPTGYEEVVVPGSVRRGMGIVKCPSGTVNGSEVDFSSGQLTEEISVEPGLFREIVIKTPLGKIELGMYSGISHLKMAVSECHKFVAGVLTKPDGSTEPFTRKVVWSDYQTEETCASPYEAEVSRRALAELEALL